MRLSRKSSSQAATFRLRRRESLPGAFGIRLWAMCLRVVKWPARENLALRQQIHVLRRTALKRLSFNDLDRLVFVWLYLRRRRCVGDRQAGHGDPLAWFGIQSLLALEIEISRRAIKGGAGDTSVDPRDELGQPTLGRAEDPRRAPQARHRHRADERGEVYGAEAATAVSRLEDLPAQSCRRHRRDGSLRGPNRFLSPALRLSYLAA